MALACECCRESKLVSVCRAGGQRALLCAACVSAGHNRDHCLVCGAGCWHCARLDHFSETHPALLAKLHNDPFPETKAEPTQRKLGTIYLPE